MSVGLQLDILAPALASALARFFLYIPQFYEILRKFHSVDGFYLVDAGNAAIEVFEGSGG